MTGMAEVDLQAEGLLLLVEEACVRYLRAVEDCWIDQSLQLTMSVHLPYCCSLSPPCPSS